MANPIKQYVNKIERLLRMDKATRLRIMTDFSGDVQARLEAGETAQQIIGELGTAEEVAAGFNAEFAGCVKPRKSRWRWLLLAGAAVPLAEVLLLGFFWLNTGAEDSSVGIIGGADGPTAIFVTTAVGGFWAVGEKFSVALSCLTAFLLLQWPAAEAAGSRVKRYLPLALAVLALVLWGAAALALVPDAGSVLSSYLFGGGLVGTVVLVFALRRRFRK